MSTHFSNNRFNLSSTRHYKTGVSCRPSLNPNTVLGCIIYHSVSASDTTSVPLKHSGCLKFKEPWTAWMASPLSHVHKLRKEHNLQHSNLPHLSQYIHTGHHQYGGYLKLKGYQSFRFSHYLWYSPLQCDHHSVFQSRNVQEMLTFWKYIRNISDVIFNKNTQYLICNSICGKLEQTTLHTATGTTPDSVLLNFCCPEITNITCSWCYRTMAATVHEAYFPTGRNIQTYFTSWIILQY